LDILRAVVIIAYSAILGRVIRTQRELRKVDLSDMSKRLGFASVSSYSRLETGEVPITVNALASIARALKVTPASLVTMADELQKTLVKK
jgi:transcriptional regulator with XRE-family HTH domain